RRAAPRLAGASPQGEARFVRNPQGRCSDPLSSFHLFHFNALKYRASQNAGISVGMDIFPI
ncbi:MAG TPA: hypothetical protein VLW75_02565, partial [Rhizomicrobium sp.]|nr:hypothetical protein [Rhizomicrobium sp.]